MVEEHVEKSKSRLKGQTPHVQGRKMHLPEEKKKQNYISQPIIVDLNIVCLA